MISENTLFRNDFLVRHSFSAGDHAILNIMKMGQSEIQHKSGRILGIDYGTKRIGVAVSDEDRQFALPLSVIAHTPGLLKEIEKIAIDHEVKEIVLGESRDYKGQPNSILLESMKFKEQLEGLGFVVNLEPEFMTSVQAERFQGKTDMSDASAAALILQAYLDRCSKNEV